MSTAVRRPVAVERAHVVDLDDPDAFIRGQDVGATEWSVAALADAGPAPKDPERSELGEPDGEREGPDGT